MKRDQVYLYRGPLYSGPDAAARRALVPYYVQHVKTLYKRPDPRMGLCRICGLPGADCTAPVR